MRGFALPMSRTLTRPSATLSRKRERASEAQFITVSTALAHSSSRNDTLRYGRRAALGPVASTNAFHSARRVRMK